MSIKKFIFAIFCNFLQKLQKIVYIFYCILLLFLKFKRKLQSYGGLNKKCHKICYPESMMKKVSQILMSKERVFMFYLIHNLHNVGIEHKCIRKEVHQKNKNKLMKGGKSFLIYKEVKL
jgi:hypothetical protein